MGDAGLPPSSIYIPPIKSIAIIGAGPTGLSVAKYLLVEEVFTNIVIYEQRSTVGGIWNLSSNEQSRRISLPQEDPRYGELPSREDDDKGGGEDPRDGGETIFGDGKSLEFESPLYEYLETNIPKPLMQFSDKAFDEKLPLFPGHKDVQEYLERYAEDVRGLIRFNTAVKDVRPVPNESGSEQEQWDVTTKYLHTGDETTQRYDAVVVANGHYTIPHVPSISGLASWAQRYPGTVIHSKAYRRPQDYTGQKVLVIGNSASGLDIASQIASCAKTPVLLSSRSESAFGTHPANEFREDVDEIREFLPAREAEKAVRFKSGRVEHEVDAVIFATGYFYSYPFFSNSDIKTQITNADGTRLQGLYRDLFSIEYPSLVFPVINTKVVPFPLSQNQASVIARAWSGRLILPPKEEMKAWEDQMVRKKGDRRGFHTMRFPDDARVINELFWWAGQAERREGLENEGRGREGVRWDERMVWLRSQFPAIKAAFGAKGDDRVGVRSVEELGFDFDKWRAGAGEEAGNVFEQSGCYL
jgi:cation diffusion facilitator CzcD-associated flavoprotein CzcO